MEKKIVSLISKSLSIRKNSTRRRGDSSIHASAISNACPRMFAMSKAHDLEIYGEEKLHLALALTFAIGSKIQSIVEENLMIVYGYWLCLHCQELSRGYKPHRCPSCGRGNLRYVETELTFEKDGFVYKGHVDLLLREDPESPIYITEVKSIRPEDFVGMVEPLIDHTYQARSYLWMAEEMSKRRKIPFPGIDLKTAYIVYVCKTYQQSPIKVFSVSRDRVYNNYLKAFLDPLKTFSLTGELPRRICTTDNHPFAKKCPIKRNCFTEASECVQSSELTQESPEE